MEPLSDPTVPSRAAGPADLADPAGRRERNRRLLRQLDRSADERERLRLRNALISANLPLARSIAARHRQPRREGYDDLVQVAALGLIRAVDAFDPSRSASLTSFAVPFMRGALLHDQRDRQAPVRIPRALWERRQQAARVQEERRGRGLPPLDRRELARQLGCSLVQLDELESLAGAAHPRSLDAPLGQPGDDGSGMTLLDRLADPLSLNRLDDVEDEDDHQGEGGVGLSAPEGDDPQAAMLHWLNAQLAGLDSLRRALVVGRMLENCTWVELGRRHGIHPRMAQRRCDAALLKLQSAALEWQAWRTLRPGSRATGPSPTERRAGSGGR